MENRLYYKKKRNKTLPITILLLILLLIICFLIYKIYMQEVNANDNLNQNEVFTQLEAPTIKSEEEKNIKIAQMLQNAMPTIVGVSKIKNNGSTVLNINSTEQLGIGSGVIISEKGYILTNAHVSGDKYSTCYITLKSGESLTGLVVWADNDIDLSIIKVNQQFAEIATIGDSEKINIGETVYAIGNPIGMEFQRTVTSGIISAVDRAITFKEGEETIYMSNLIQTDATINPGNSGGPLLNIYGEIIGINTVKLTSAEGIGFAVPINIIKPILEKLEQTGKFEEATIGILGYDKSVAQYLYSDIKFENGVYVISNIQGSNANNNGIYSGDIIVKIDNTEVKKISDLRQYIYTKQPGDDVKLEILRKNQTIEVVIKLGRKP